MSFWNFISENKTLSGVLAAAGLGGAVIWYVCILLRAYKKYKEEQEPEEE